MKKYFLLGILAAIVPNICFGASARFTQLAREKERKMEELEKCLGSNKGLKIAGISTLGLTAVGVAGNVVEAKKIKDYDKNIESTSKSIAKTEEEISNKNAELAAIKAEKERKEKESQVSVSTQKPETGENNVVVSYDDLETKCNDSGGAWQKDYNKCWCGDLTELNDQTGECEYIQVEIPEVEIEEPQQTGDQNKNNDSNASNNAVSNYDENCKNSGGKIDGRDKCICKGNKKPDPNGTCKEEKLEDNSSEEGLVDDNKEDQGSNDLYCAGIWSVSEFYREYSTRDSVEEKGSYFCARDNTCICDDADTEEIYRGVLDDCCHECGKACAKAFKENQ